MVESAHRSRRHWLAFVDLGWPARYLGPAPGLKEINLVCWGLFLGFVVFPILLPVALLSRSGGGFSSLLPVDFIYFYGDGRIVDTYPIARLYDYNLQLQTFNAIFPLYDGAFGPSPYPPFVGLVFSVLARLNFWHAYLVWLGISAALYLAGTIAAVRVAFPNDPLKMSIAVCLGLGYYPCVIGTLANGQLAAIAVCSAGLAIYFERRRVPFWSGAALSILIYKPTLLLIILPMLLLTRRFRALLGFAAGATVWMTATTLLAGVQIWLVYLHFLREFGRTAGVGGHSMLRLWEYVDFSSFVNALLGGRSTAGSLALLLVAGAIATALGWVVWRSVGAGMAVQSLVWAATLTWTLLLNVYVPLWDTILISISLALTIGATHDLGWRAASRWTVLLAVLLVAVSWGSSAVAKEIRLQPLTVLFSLLGVAQLLLLNRALHSGTSAAKAA